MQKWSIQPTIEDIGEIEMEDTLRKLGLNLAKLDSNQIRLIIVLLSLILFVLGAGAPDTPGGFGG
jgi:hypothetical protein